MGRQLGAVLIYGIAISAILFLPASHLAKHVLIAGDRFSAFEAREALLEDLKSSEFLFVQPDNLATPLISLIAEQYASGGKRARVTTLFEIDYASRSSEMHFAREWICQVAAHPDKSFIWGNYNHLIEDHNHNDELVVVKYRSYYREFEVLLRRERVVYAFSKAKYIRGKVVKITASPLPTLGSDSGLRILYNAPEVPAVCL
jgi:hypothetical protein